MTRTQEKMAYEDFATAQDIHRKLADLRMQANTVTFGAGDLKVLLETAEEQAFDLELSLRDRWLQELR